MSEPNFNNFIIPPGWMGKSSTDLMLLGVISVQNCVNALQRHCMSHHVMHKTAAIWFLKRAQHNYQTFRSSLVKITLPLRKAEKMTHYSYHSCCVWSKKQPSSVTPPRPIHCVEVVLETHRASWRKMTSAAKIKQYLPLMICGIEKHGLFLL